MGDLPDAPRARERQQPPAPTVKREGIEHGVLMSDCEASSGRGPTTKWIAAAKPQTYTVTKKVAGTAPPSRRNNIADNNSRSNSAMLAKIPKIRRPFGVDVSTPSWIETNRCPRLETLPTQ